MADDIYSYFKFRAINKHLVESLATPSWYFSTPAALNDPFDCRLNLKRYLENAVSSTSGRTQLNLRSIIENPGYQDWDQKFQNVGVCSFSLTPDETLLWSHYADQHRGVCLLYNIPASFLLDKGNRIIGVDKITYGDEKMMECLTTLTGDAYKFTEVLIKTYLTTKSPSWRYEAEARIIREVDGLLQIPGHFLEQVCFGLRTESVDIDLVTKLARRYCGCLKFSKMARDASNFGLEMKEL